MNTIIRFASVVGVVLGGGSDAFALTDCNEILRLGLYNTSASANSVDAKSVALSQLCEHEYSSASITVQGSIKASYYYIFKGKAAFSDSEVTQAQHDLCTIGFNSVAYMATASDYSKQVFQGSVDAWSQCNAIEARGMDVTFNTSPDFTVANISLTWHGTPGAKFTGLYVPTDTQDMRGKAVCRVSLPGGIGSCFIKNYVRS